MINKFNYRVVRTMALILCTTLLFSGCGNKEKELESTYLEIAQIYINEKNYDAAVEILQKATESSDSKDVQIMLAEALLLQAQDLQEQDDSADVTNNKTNNELTEEDNDAKNEYVISTPKNDIDMGMRSIKIDSADVELTDDQRLVREYFDRDYLTIYNCDDLHRYPDAYEKTQVYITGIVDKVVSSEENKIELILRTNDGYDSVKNKLVYVSATQSNVRVIQGDCICVYGRYQGIETITVDGNSHVLPSIKAFRTLFAENEYDLPEKFDHSDIKKIASLILGNGIDVRYPNNENETGRLVLLDGGWSLNELFIVELENKTNSRFDMFRFYTQLGYIDVVGDENSTIVRTVEFMQDFQHFLVISYDYALSTSEITCYDTNLQRVWTREFENVEVLTQQIPYDYTKNNVYVAVNNRIYIINAETGEDTYDPVYVGQKTEIRKLKNGILAFSAEKVDPIMFMDLTGNIQWTTNIEHCLGINGVGSLQIVDDKIVAQASFIRAIEQIIVLNKETGELILQCVPSTYF